MTHDKPSPKNYHHDHAPSERPSDCPACNDKPSPSNAGAVFTKPPCHVCDGNPGYTEHTCKRAPEGLSDHAALIDNLRSFEFTEGGLSEESAALNLMRGAADAFEAVDILSRARASGVTDGEFMGMFMSARRYVESYAENENNHPQAREAACDLDRRMKAALQQGKA